MTPPDGEPETRRALSRIVPWVASVGLHAGLIGLGFLITWTVVSLSDDDDPVLNWRAYTGELNGGQLWMDIPEPASLWKQPRFGSGLV